MADDIFCCRYSSDFVCSHPPTIFSGFTASSNSCTTKLEGQKSRAFTLSKERKHLNLYAVIHPSCPPLLLHHIRLHLCYFFCVSNFLLSFMYVQVRPGGAVLSKPSPGGGREVLFPHGAERDAVNNTLLLRRPRRIAAVPKMCFPSSRRRRLCCLYCAVP